MLCALFSVVSFAQEKSPMFKPIKATRTNVQVTPLTGKAITNAARRSAEDIVTPPAGLATEAYTLQATFTAGNSQTDDTRTIQIGIDGTDVYFQGFSHYASEGWVKGTLNAEKTSITLASPQYYGVFNSGGTDYPIYFIYNRYVDDSDDTYPTELVLGYDAASGEITLPTGSNTYFLEGAAAVNEWSCYGYSLIKGIVKGEPVAPEVVVLPDGVVAEPFAMSYKDNNGNDCSTSVNVAVDGNDVYIQKLSSYLPDAWVKGTKNGNNVIFAANQYMGDYAKMQSFFFYSGEATFVYDAETESYSAEGEIFGVLGEQYYDGRYFNPVLKKVVEVAATPANPTITGIEDSSYGDVVVFNVPVTDVNGNGMVGDKLSFQFFVDIEQEISPLTFTPEYFSKLTEPMTVIPFGFTEGYDFYPTYIYLNMPHDTWNKIGIQSTYTGGDEEHKSEITWFTIKEYTKVTIDFNSMDVPTSSQDSDAGDITAATDFTAGSVVLTVSPSTTGTPNRMWGTNDGPQLRMYSGTLTFSVPITKVIKSITFNTNNKWNTGNSADCGTLDGKEWTGNERKVVFTIAGNSQINSINIVTDDYVPTPVEVPEDLETATYIFSAQCVEAGEEEEVPEAYEYQTEVGFDGNDVYFKGLSDNTADMWVKATKNADGKYVIPALQYMGQLSFFGVFVFDYYVTAMDETGNAADIVLDYDADSNKFTTSQKVVLNGALDDWDPYQTFTQVAITKFVEVAATPATPTFESINFVDTEYPSIYCSIPAVGTNGETLNANKLFYTVWVEKNGESQKYTFTAARYADDFDEDVVEVPYKHDGEDLYAYGEIIYFEETLDELATWSKVGIQSIYYGAGERRESDIAWMENGSTDGISDIKADRQNGNAVIYNLAGQRIANGQKPTAKGLYIINGKKVMVK